MDRLIDAVGSSVLGKRKAEDDDVIVLDGKTELSCDIFSKLRPGEWFDAWLILACMTISKKPHFVRCGYSVPLDQLGPSGKISRIRRPLAGWRKKVDNFRREVQPQSHGEEYHLIHLCSLKHENRHFSLLEINEQDRTIYHYDSMASQEIIDATVTADDAVEPTRVDKLVLVSVCDSWRTAAYINTTAAGIRLLEVQVYRGGE